MFKILPFLDVHRCKVHRTEVRGSYSLGKAQRSLPRALLSLRPGLRPQPSQEEWKALGARSPSPHFPPPFTPRTNLVMLPLASFTSSSWLWNKSGKEHEAATPLRT